MTGIDIGFAKYLNMLYGCKITIIFTLKKESLNKITVFGLKPRRLYKGDTEMYQNKPKQLALKNQFLTQKKCLLNF